jgi:glutamyl-tRNA synthetase
VNVVRTRFAPSPTGMLHVGGVRTALFSWLFARHHGGSFVLRIEDTDRKRSRPEFTEGILEAMEWLGLKADEGPLFQSERGDGYAVAIEKLLATGHAYRCTCTSEELEAKRESAKAAGRGFAYDRHCRPGFGPGPVAERPASIRFAAPLEGEVRIEDAVKGPIVVNNAEIDDFIIARSDGSPTYHLVVTVDDIDMKISHVIRGDDHINNTTKQIHIYLALDAALPTFAHLPQVLGKDKARLSKRHGATDVLAYRDEGYFPDALVNFLARLGWSHGDQEIFSPDELVELFCLESIGRSAGVFDLEKLEWLNFEYLKARSPEQLAGELQEFLARRGEALPGDSAWQAKMVASLQERARNLVQLADACRYFIEDEIRFDDKAVRKQLTPESGALLNELADRLEATEGWVPERLEKTLRALVDEKEIKLGKLAQPVRVACTGGTVSPGIFDVLDILGRERSLARLRAGATRGLAN